MKTLLAASAACLAALAATALPAAAGDRYYVDRYYGTWADGYRGERYYDDRYAERDYYYVDRRAQSVPDYAPHVYVPYGSIYADEPFDYSGEGECTIKRKWRHGRVKETIKCDDDD